MVEPLQETLDLNIQMTNAPLYKEYNITHNFWAYLPEKLDSMGCTIGICSCRTYTGPASSPGPTQYIHVIHCTQRRKWETLEELKQIFDSVSTESILILKH